MLNHKWTQLLRHIKHIVVIYQENWSFDSLYGLFPGASGLAQSSSKSLNQTDRFDQPLRAQTGQPFSLVSGSLKLLTPPPSINNGQIDMRKIACISGEAPERQDSSLSRPTVQIGSRRRDHCSARTSRSADGDGRQNRGLIALSVVIICSRSAVRVRRSLCAHRFCGRMRSCSNH
jgi:hypothetical protein